jgi:putative endonuclease
LPPRGFTRKSCAAKDFRAVSSVVERLVYTERVGGSKPSPPSLRSQRNGERRLSRRRFSEAGPFSPCNVNAASFDSACQSEMRTFTYVYVLQSETDSRRFYTGCTFDLRKRLARHNNGEALHTAKWKPWRIKTYIAFSDRVQAKVFEQYLKSASGRAFLKKRLQKSVCCHQLQRSRKNNFLPLGVFFGRWMQAISCD